MNFGNVENVLSRGVGGSPTSTGDMERMSSEPQEPGFFSASNSNERMSYNLWQELRAETMKRNLLMELDRANNPMSLGDVSRITGQGADVLATEAQRTVPKYGEPYQEKYKEEGPQPMGMVPIDKEVVDVVNPLQSQFTPRQLLGDNPLPEMSAVAWDQYDRRQAPYWKPGPDEAITRDILAPGIIQGPGAPIEKERTVRETVGFSPNERADATPWQRQMAEAKIHQMGLRPLVGANGKPSSVRERFEMLVPFVGEERAAMIVGGAAQQDTREVQTGANVALMGSKERNLDEQTRVSKEMFNTRKNYYNQQARLAAARADDLKDTAPDKKAHLQQQTKTAQALEQYYQHRMESGDIELAIRESKLMQSLNEADRKQLVAAMKFLKDNKMEISGEQFDQMIDSIGQGLGFRGTISQAPLTDRLWNAITGNSEANEEEPASFELPSQRAPMPQGESAMRGSGSIKRSNVPNKDAASVLSEMAKELGDLSKLEGKVVRDAKTGKRYRVQGGKLQEAK